MLQHELHVAAVEAVLLLLLLRDLAEVEDCARWVHAADIAVYALTSIFRGCKG